MKTILYAGLVALVCVAAPLFADGDETDAANPSGHSMNGDAFNEGPRQAAYLMPGMPKVHFPVTCSTPEAQAFFDQGVGQLHGFWYFEAERSFRQVQALDPKCVMAYWGMARANVNNMERGRGFLAKAVARASEVSERERMWIDALAAYYRLNAPKDSKDDPKARRKTFIAALENIVEKCPDDLEAKAFLFLQVWDNAGEWPIGSRMAVDALAKDVLAVNPMHPIHHYRVHLWDGSADARRSLESAALCGQSGPGIAHLWHMPGGHTYTPLKRYRDAVFQQEASNRVDHFHMEHDWVMPDLIHNYAHNSSWLAGNLSFLGRVTDALAIARNLIEMPRHPKYNLLTLAKAQPGYNAGNSSAKLGREKLLDITLRFELWDDLIALEQHGYLDTDKDSAEVSRCARALALAHYFKKELSTGDAQVETIRAAKTTLAAEREAAAVEAEKKATEQKKKPDEIKKAREDAFKAKDDLAKKLDARLDELLAVRFYAEGNFKETLARFGKLDGLPRELKILMRYNSGDKDEAEKQARQFVKDTTNQIPPLALLADILWRNQKADEARATFTQLRALDGKMDLDVPVFARLKPIAQALQLPADWRVAPAEAKDVGVRPPLESLGPFLWSPVQAPAFSLIGPGKEFSLEQYRGRPVLLLFYLGHTCTQCLTQLNAFAPAAKDYAAAGINIVAISIDAHENIGKTLAKAQVPTGFPFPILADPTLDVFKRYRAYDDFEKIPLHGTFLVDREGRIIWQDIGPEPFTGVEFLLGEAKRLLALKQTTL